MLGRRRRSMATQREVGVDDLVMLQEIKADKILDNLKRRYARDIIYTNIGNTLISVNPFKLINGLYGNDICRNYLGKPRHEVPPHTYCIGDAAFRGLTREDKSQAIIITGESGSGKTEVSKQILSFIAAVSTASAEVQRVSSQLLASNPILEAFGNAKTLRNNNSSRFGKYMEVEFLNGGPSGARVYNYLLEKSRVVSPGPGERNFHIFYMILAGLSAQEKEQYYLQGPDSYLYLTMSGEFNVDGWNDVQELQAMRQGFQNLGFRPDEEAQVYRLLSAILWMGNIQFFENQAEESSVTDQQTLDLVAHLLGIDSPTLTRALVERTITTGSGARTEVFHKPNTQANANKTRDTLAKSLYSSMFDWIVRRINEALAPPQGSSGKSIGVLDIYGFEIFEYNSFEQLCINYTNERLQQIFIELTLKSEQEEYRAEGIPWQDIRYHDNKPTCELIENKPGFFSILDDSCNTSKTDQMFLEQLGSFFSSNPSLAVQSRYFVIRHYAGDVSYQCEGFIEKNKDTLFDDLILAVQSSREAYVQDHGWAQREVSTGQRKRPISAGTQYKRSCVALMDALTACSPHYVRCIKPTDSKRPNDFQSNRVKEQVRYLGLLENVKVRRAGYAFRQPYEPFLSRYGCLSPQTWPRWQGYPADGVRVLLSSLGWTENQLFIMGATKVFIKDPQSLFELEELLERRQGDIVVILQRFVRRALGCTRMNQLRGRAYELYGGRKCRRQLSVDREYRFDYVSFGRDPAVLSLLGQNMDGRIRFAAAVNHVARIKKRLLRSNMKMTEPRFIVVTDRSVYSLSYIRDEESRRDNLCQHMRVELPAIMGISMSQEADNFMIIHVAQGDAASANEDLVFECAKKTELMAVLDQVRGGGLQLNITNNMEANLRKGHKIRLNVAVTTGLPNGVESELRVERSAYKVMCLGGIPGNQVPAPQPISMAAKRGANAFANGRQLGGGRGPPTGGFQAGAVGGGRPPAAGGGGGAQQQLRALYDYAATNQVELSIRAGETLTLVSKPNNDWWVARSAAGQQGEVPAAYVEEIASQPPAPARQPPPPGPRALPPGWQEVSTPDGQKYYWNEQTNATSWDRP